MAEHIDTALTPENALKATETVEIRATLVLVFVILLTTIVPVFVTHSYQQILPIFVWALNIYLFGWQKMVFGTQIALSEHVQEPSKDLEMCLEALGKDLGFEGQVEAIFKPGAFLTPSPSLLFLGPNEQCEEITEPHILKALLLMASQNKGLTSLAHTAVLTHSFETSGQNAHSYFKAKAQINAFAKIKIQPHWIVRLNAKAPKSWLQKKI